MPRKNSPSRLAIRAMVAATVLLAPIVAAGQGVKQIVGMPRLDPTTLAMGFRASKVIGMAVANDAGETIGRIHDVIISREGIASRAVVATGGFMGIGSRQVLIPYSDLRITETRAMLPGGSLATLRELPEFKFAR